MNYRLARAFGEGEGWRCESDCNEVNGARVMPHHPARQHPPHTTPQHPHPPHLLTPPTLLRKPLAIRAEDIKKPWHILSRTIRRLSPLVHLFTDCYRHRGDGGEAIFCKWTFISKPCLRGKGCLLQASSELMLKHINWQLSLTTVC